MEHRVISSLTEIYISGGGNFITQSYPTNFHTFTTQMVIPKSDNIDNYMEVTPEQRSDFEKSDAAWSRPPQAFIDMWNAACGKWGTYNESTGFFELNDLTDISYDEARLIFSWGPITSSDCDQRYRGAKIRTNLPMCVGSYNWAQGMDSKGFYISQFIAHSSIEVLNLSNTGGYFLIHPQTANNVGSFQSDNIRKILGYIDCGRVTRGNNINLFIKMPKLEEISLGAVCGPIRIPDSPKLSYRSLKFLTQQKIDRPSQIGTLVTVTVHPDVYAKITGDIANPAVSALSPEELKDWMALSDLAATRNITFATL